MNNQKKWRISGLLVFAALTLCSGQNLAAKELAWAVNAGGSPTEAVASLTSLSPSYQLILQTQTGHSEFDRNLGGWGDRDTDRPPSRKARWGHV